MNSPLAFGLALGRSRTGGSGGAALFALSGLLVIACVGCNDPCASFPKETLQCPPVITGGVQTVLFGSLMAAGEVKFTDITGKSISVLPSGVTGSNVTVKVPTQLACGPVTIAIVNGSCSFATCTSVFTSPQCAPVDMTMAMDAMPDMAVSSAPRTLDKAPGAFAKPETAGIKATSAGVFALFSDSNAQNYSIDKITNGAVANVVAGAGTIASFDPSSYVVYGEVPGPMGGTNGIFAAPIAGGAPVSISPVPNVYSIASDATWAYFYDQGSRAINNVKLDGSSMNPNPLVALGFQSQVALTADATGLYFSKGSDAAASVQSSPLGGTMAPTTIAPVSPMGAQDYLAMQIAVDATNVYWLAADAAMQHFALLQAPKTGGAGTAVVLVPSASALIGGFVVSGSTVYYTLTLAGQIMKVPVGGGAPSLVWSNLGQPTVIDADATNLYWGNLAGEVVTAPQ